jgi:hypothetical protein
LNKHARFRPRLPPCSDTCRTKAVAVLASRDVHRREFRATGVYQRFSLTFNLAGRAGHAIETRVYWRDNAFVNLDKIVVNTAPPPPASIVIDSDNAKNDPARGYFQLSDVWVQSATNSSAYGDTYWWVSTAAVSDPAQFFFYLDAPGTRTIDAWWVSGTNRAPAAPYIVADSAGTQLANVKVDQRAGGGQWNTLGTWAFPAGWNRVMLSRWAASGAVVIADAVRVR